MAGIFLWMEDFGYVGEGSFMEQLGSGVQAANPHPPIGRKPRPSMLIIPSIESPVATPRTPPAKKAPKMMSFDFLQPRKRSSLWEELPMSPLDLDNCDLSPALLASCFGREEARGARVRAMRDAPPSRASKWETRGEAFPEEQPCVTWADSRGTTARVRKLERMMAGGADFGTQRVGKEFLEAAAPMWRDVGQLSSNGYWQCRPDTSVDMRKSWQSGRNQEAESDSSFLGALLTPEQLPATSGHASLLNSEEWKGPPKSYRDQCYPSATEITSAVSGALMWLLTGDNSVRTPTDKTKNAPSSSLKAEEKQRDSSPVSVFSPYLSSGESSGTSPTPLEL